MYTTLKAIRAHRPCQDGWEKLLRTLNKTKADDEPVSIVQILDSNGLDDALWCLQAVEGYDRELRLFAVWCARQVENLMLDQRSKDALDVAERYANGVATDEELSDARDAARSDARDAARSAAWDAARSAAWATAWSAAWATAWAAAVAATSDAAWAAARNAASYAVWATAWSAARSAAWAAEDAARDAVRAAQSKELRRICAEIEAEMKEQA